MKKTTNWMLMALLVVGIGMSFASCKEDELTEEEKQQQAEKELKEALEWWDVVSQLTDVQELPDEWQKATFEPAIGKALESDPYTRVVSTNDLATAAQRFAYLTGASVNETTADYTWSHKDAGSLTYHAGSTAGTYLAQVDVNLKQMPKLKKILYQTPEQMGENTSGDFSGTAYYRFGDVVKKKRSDGMYDYWICVRPAFSLESKGDSHWVCITNPLPNENIYSWTKNDITWNVPTKLGENKEHMQNFAELIYAILDPTQYYGNLADLKLKTFHDFDREKFTTYHGQLFWKRVSKAWEKEKLFGSLFKATSDADFKRMIEQDGLTLLYKGYSWKIGWTCSLWQANYKNESNNMHTATYTTPSCYMKDIVFDATKFDDGKSYYDGFFKDGKTRYIVRYAKGETLCKDEKGKGSYSVKQRLTNCEDVYVYNSYFYQDETAKFCDMGAAPETEEDIKKKEDSNIEAKPLAKVTKDDRGKFVGQDGKIYNSREDATKAKTKAVALVIDTFNTDFEAIFGSATQMSNSSLERSYGLISHGIAIALEDGTNGDYKEATETTEVKNYDTQWYENNKLPPGTANWLVPNSYHWQRLALPYVPSNEKGVIKLSKYLYEMIPEWSKGYDNEEIPYSRELLRELDKAGAPLKRDAYQVAGGDCKDPNSDDPKETTTYSVMVTSTDYNVYWCCPQSGNYSRYVLVW